MSPHTIAVIGTVVLLLLLAVRVPVAAALLTVGLVGLTVVSGSGAGDFSLAAGFDAAVSFMSRDAFSFIASFSLMAVPMFLLMGNFAFHARATSEAFDTARAWLGRLPGGLALATIAGCGMFAAISGSSMATASAMGKIAVPEMLRSRYSRSLAAGCVAAGGTIGALIPPSILMIIYGVFAEQSIGKLLIAGLVPGLLTMVGYMLVTSIWTMASPAAAPRTHMAVSWGDRLRSLRGTGQFLVLFVVVMGSVYGGIATPTEAAAVGAMGALIIGACRGKLSREGMRLSVMESLKQAASIFAIAIGAKAYVSFIGFTGIAPAIAASVGGTELHPLLVLLLLSCVYIVLGMFMDPLGIMLLTLPVVVPIIQQLGYDLIWFGVIMVKYLEIGMITPPVGLNVFVLKGAVGNLVKLEEIFKGIGFFLLADLVVLALLLGVPEITLWLPNLMS